MITITREWLQQKIAEIEATRDDIPFGLDEDDSNTLAALRIALASLTAEPVGTFRKGPCGYSPSFHEEAVPLYTAPPAPVVNAEPVAWKAGNRAFVTRVVAEMYASEIMAEIKPLYAAPPAPVVPDIDRRAIADKVYGKCCRIPGATFYNAAEFAIDEIESLRAAMLQAGNSPVTPDGWIPVSERMPEGSEEVLCTKEFDGPGDWRRKVGYWHEGKWVVYGASWTPTHWMPLPAAPKQTEG
ncbi:TPA_asm: DUF551 domain-containing protein [Salmonella enterica subsp. enterica serovar Ank]|uniref:DUF551 domain-containing protein n=1 Tax=Salmonella enterica subsp. enterica serovar Ank TaxID=1173578 RepID=A0A727BHV9_SALET|nr:DUF551 domain-containing protein [Salmonella enterica subsp. enterica serovar Ank]